MSAHTSQTELKLIGKLILEGDMTCETGLHVGAGKGSLEIGGSEVDTSTFAATINGFAIGNEIDLRRGIARQADGVLDDAG